MEVVRRIVSKVLPQDGKLNFEGLNGNVIAIDVIEMLELIVKRLITDDIQEHRF